MTTGCSTAISTPCRTAWGIEFDKNSYLWDEENPISSRYVMCGRDTRVAARLLAENWQQVVSTEDLVIYKRP